jgi:hypothetical protein
VQVVNPSTGSELESPNCTHIVSGVLTVVGGTPKAEVDVPRVEDVVIRTTPIVVISKTANHAFFFANTKDLVHILKANTSRHKKYRQLLLNIHYNISGKSITVKGALVGYYNCCVF